MKICAENYAVKLARITDEVSKEIFKSYEENSDTANQLQELWKRECRSEEESKRCFVCLRGFLGEGEMC